MASTEESRRVVFQTLIESSYPEWPAYESTPLYDRGSARSLIRIIAISYRRWDAERAFQARTD
jgi:hypothetical protein